MVDSEDYRPSEQDDDGTLIPEMEEAAESPVADAPYAWTCSCGWTMPAYGADKEWIPPLRHLGLKDGQTHRIVGLMDRTSGDFVLRGLDSTGFQRMFHVGRFSPDRVEKAQTQSKSSTSGSGAGGGNRSNVRDFPSRRLRVLAQDVEVSDLISIAMHLVARRLPELVPPELLATEAGYAYAMGRFLEDCVIVTLSILTQTYPDRFSPADLNMAVIASEAQRRLKQLGG